MKTKNEVKPTPTPWSFNNEKETYGENEAIPIRAHGEVVATACALSNRKANAAFIVKAVNAYEGMAARIEALENESFQKARAAE